MLQRAVLVLLVSAAAFGQADRRRSPAASVPKTSYNTVWEYAEGFPSGCITVSPIPGRANELCPHSLPSAPAVGGTYFDPVYGSAIRIVGAGAINVYSSPTALSATGRYANLAGNPDVLVETETGRVIRTPPMNQHGLFFWDTHDDDTFYWASNLENGVKNIYRGSVADPAHRDLLLVVSGEIYTGGTGGLTADSWFAFAKENRSTICAAPLDGSGRTFCAPLAMFPRADNRSLDFMLITDIDEEAGKRYLVLLPWGIVASVDESAGTLRYEYTPPEHPQAKALGLKGDGDGICETGEACVGPYMDHGDVFRVQMADGRHRVYLLEGIEWGEYPFPDGKRYGRQLLAYRLNSSPERFLRDAIPMMQWQGAHNGCAKLAPVCVASSHATSEKFTDDVTLLPPAVAMQGDIVVMRMNRDLSVTVHRVARHASFPFQYPAGDDYYSYPRAGVSADGKQVIYTTTLGKKPPETPRWAAVAATGF